MSARAAKLSSVAKATWGVTRQRLVESSRWSMGRGGSCSKTSKAAPAMRLSMRPKPGYTTVSKQVGFLEEKGFLQRRPIANTFLYKPAISERDYHGITIGDVVNKYYGKSYSSLVLHFVEDKKMDLDELKEIIDLIEHKDK